MFKALAICLLIASTMAADWPTTMTSADQVIFKACGDLITPQADGRDKFIAGIADAACTDWKNAFTVPTTATRSAVTTGWATCKPKLVAVGAMTQANSDKYDLCVLRLAANGLTSAGAVAAWTAYPELKACVGTQGTIATIEDKMFSKSECGTFNNLATVAAATNNQAHFAGDATRKTAFDTCMEALAADTTVIAADKKVALKDCAVWYNFNGLTTAGAHKTFTDLSNTNAAKFQKCLVKYITVAAEKSGAEKALIQEADCKNTWTFLTGTATKAATTTFKADADKCKLKLATGNPQTHWDACV